MRGDDSAGIWKLASANLRKRKGVACSLGILIILAVALLNAGIIFLTGMEDFFTDKNEELYGPHYFVRFSGNNYKDSYLDFFKNSSLVSEAELEEAVTIDSAKYIAGSGETMATFNIFNADTPRRILPLTLIDRIEVTGDNAVYVPRLLYDQGYELGDELIIEIKNKPYKFTIAGYFETTWFGSSLTALLNLYMPDESYSKLFREIGGGRVLSVRLYDAGHLPELIQEFEGETGIRIDAAGYSAQTMAVTIDEVKSVGTLIIMIVSMIECAFAFIIVVVVLIVIQFRVNNHIRDHMQNIGAMQAIGYTAGQIKWSIALEFLMIGFVGAALGAALSYGVIAMMGGVVSDCTGVTWNGGFHPAADLLSIVTVMVLVLFVSMKAAGKLNKMSPITALRGGVTTHSFMKNHFPLERSPWELQTNLALKNMAGNRRQYIMVAFIYAGITFASAFGVILYVNLGADSGKIVEMTGYESSDIVINLAKHGNYDRVRDAVSGMEGVRSTSLFEDQTVSIDGNIITCYISDDFSRWESVKTYKGSLPENEKEIVITGVLAKILGKEIGDRVSVKAEGVTETFIISGFSQTISNFGRQCILELDGFRRMNPLYRPSGIQVYLEDDIAAEDFIGRLEDSFQVIMTKEKGDREEESPKERAKRAATEKMENLLSMYGVDSAQYAMMVDGEILISGNTYEYEVESIDNFRATVKTMLTNVTSGIRSMAVGILAATLFIICLVLYMVIKSMIIRRRQELGIYKAIGYSDFQLMRQIAVSFLPSTIIGTTAGCILGKFATAPFVSSALGMMGISKLELSVYPLVLVGLGSGIVLFSFAVSMTLAYKVRKISVYALLTE